MTEQLPSTPTNIIGYTTRQLMERWDVTRGRINQLSRRYNWYIVMTIGNTNIYSSEDVEAYEAIRQEKYRRNE